MRKILNYKIIIILLLSLFELSLSQVRFYGNNYLEYSIDQKYNKQYFEDWLEAFVTYRNFRLGARYEIHSPPQPYSQDTSGHGLYQRFVEYQNRFLNVTIGNYYTLFGRGLVLRSFENRTLRWDTNFDGGKIEIKNFYLDAQVISGKPRDLTGKRHEWLHGGEIRLKPLSQLHIGGTFVTTDLNEKGKFSWGSLLGVLNLNWIDFYFERAFKNFPEVYNKGKAYYSGMNLFVGNLTVLLEYRLYDEFDISQGLTYNNPPTVFREHLYTLLNRHQRVQDARDERGYQIELSYPVKDMAVVLLNHSQTKNRDGKVLFREFYFQTDIDPRDFLNVACGIGEQRDLMARYLNFVGSGKWEIADYHAVRTIFEHQHAQILLTDRQYYDQMLTLGYDFGAKYSFSLIAEKTTDQLVENNYWIAGQLDIRLPHSFELTAFAGKRRKGKICVGGICLNKPAFEGIEFRIANRF